MLHATSSLFASKVAFGYALPIKTSASCFQLAGGNRQEKSGVWYQKKSALFAWKRADSILYILSRAKDVETFVLNWVVDVGKFPHSILSKTHAWPLQVMHLVLVLGLFIGFH
ncbi:hypothetical protein GC194_14205 [bacterium]|nr:hypothetical protein [bacterium]